MFLWWPGKNCYSLAGSSDSSTIFTRHCNFGFPFQSLQNSLNGKNFNSLEDCKRHLEQFFAQKDKMFGEDGIMKLPEKWQKVVEQKGEYVVQSSSWWKWKMRLLLLLKKPKAIFGPPNRKFNRVQSCTQFRWPQQDLTLSRLCPWNSS